MSSLVYVYAIGAMPRGREDINGVSGGQVRWIQHDRLAAAVSDVPEEEFNQEALNANVADLQWLGPKAIAHQDVNQRLHEASDALIPLAFGTVFLDDERVRAMLGEQAASLRQRLERVRGCSEWVVTAHRLAAPDASSNDDVRQLQHEIAQAAPGRAHLLRKRLADVERDAARQVEHNAAQRVLDTLAGSARAVYQEELPEQAVDLPLLRASVLVPRVDETRFVELVEALNSSWLQVLLTGPWPAYRFGGLSEEHAGAAAN